MPTGYDSAHWTMPNVYYDSSGMTTTTANTASSTSLTSATLQEALLRFRADLAQSTPTSNRRYSWEPPHRDVEAFYEAQAMEHRARIRGERADFVWLDEEASLRSVGSRRFARVQMYADIEREDL